MLGFVEQLIVIHGKLQEGAGRRHEQDAIHRAGVVMTVAAWEGYIERSVLEALDAMEANAGVGGAPSWARHAFALRRADIKRSVKKFNTPNAVNVRDLYLESLEFNPHPHWVWHVGPRQWNDKTTRDRLDSWLLVRHSVAHGVLLPSDIPWIQDPQLRPRLTLALLKECKRFFEHVAARTDAALAHHLANHHGVANAW